VLVRKYLILAPKYIAIEVARSPLPEDPKHTLVLPEGEVRFSFPVTNTVNQECNGLKMTAFLKRILIYF
jgi:hypothetical protein